MCQPALNSKPTKARGAMTRCKASSDECWAVRLTDRAKLRATHRPAQGCGTKSVPRQGHNTPLPLKRSPPASFKRLLGADTNDLPWLHAPQGVQDSGNQGTELLEPIWCARRPQQRQDRKSTRLNSSHT